MITERAINLLFNLSLLQFSFPWMLITKVQVCIGIYNRYCSSNLSAMLTMIPLSLRSVKKRKKGAMREVFDLTGKSLLAQGAELSKAPQGSRRVLEHLVLCCSPKN